MASRLSPCGMDNNNHMSTSTGLGGVMDTEAYAIGAAWFLAAAHNTLQSQYDDDNHPALRQIKREQRVAKELREHATQKIAAKQARRDKTMGGHVSSLPDAWLDKLTNDVAIMRNIYIHMFCAPWRRQNHDVIIRPGNNGAIRIRTVEIILGIQCGTNIFKVHQITFELDP